MQRLTIALLGLLVLAGIFECKTKSSSSSAPAVSSTTSSSWAASTDTFATCATDLALAQVQPAPQVDSTQLTTQNLSVVSFDPQVGNSLAVMKITVTKDANADVVYYKVCTTGTKTCKGGIIDTPDSSSSDVNALVGYDGRFPAGNYTVTAQSAIWKDRESNTSVKTDHTYSGRPGHVFHTGDSSSAQLVGFAGTAEPYRDLYTQEFNLSDELSTNVYFLQTQLENFQNNSSINPNLRTTISNAVNLRDMYHQLAASPLLAETQNAANATSLGLVGTSVSTAVGTSTDVCGNMTDAIQAATASSPAVAAVSGTSEGLAEGTGVATSTSLQTASSTGGLAQGGTPVSNVATSATTSSGGGSSSSPVKGGLTIAAGVGMLGVGSVIFVSSAASAVAHGLIKEPFANAWTKYKMIPLVNRESQKINWGGMPKKTILLLARPADAFSYLVGLAETQVSRIKQPSPRDQATIKMNVGTSGPSESEPKKSAQTGSLLPESKAGVTKFAGPLIGMAVGAAIFASGVAATGGGAAMLSLEGSDPTSQVLNLAATTSAQVTSISNQINTIDAKILSLGAQAYLNQ